MTPDDRAAIIAAAHAVAATAPPLTPAQRDHLNDLFRDATRVVLSRPPAEGKDDHA